MLKNNLQIGNKTGKIISPELYGQFSEHLGRCIYDGIYVGDDSDIPNVNGMRKDVVDALKEIGVPVLRWPEDALQTNIIGVTASEIKQTGATWLIPTGAAW